MCIGYEGMRSFAVVKNNLTSTDLIYWLDQKDFYSPGLMKAAYGTFVSVKNFTGLTYYPHIFE